MANIDLQISMRPRKITVSEHYYTVRIYFEETLAKELEMWYNTYQEAEEAARKYILERLA